uniref:Uncharacterized protein n=1 Tax=Candidatus Kentrum sp. LPFa TaxID=2126335 RepID=A0A450WMF2_9GAMM|nr:MAG: hypothetical protein BECKLPF1236B_GA0070989_11366 [Candidatus Kentron sp. LPFa]
MSGCLEGGLFRVCAILYTTYYETTAPIRGRRVDRYAGTFFICWGDETLNMIVRNDNRQLPILSV